MLANALDFCTKHHYARARAVQRKLTDEACRPDQDRDDIGACCPTQSMVRESYGGIIGDAPIRAIPFGRMAIVRDSLRRCAYAAMLEGIG